MSSAIALASICLSTGLVSAGIVAVVVLVDLPFLNRRKDSRNDFLNDFLLEMGSPAFVRSCGFNVHLCKTGRLLLKS